MATRADKQLENALIVTRTVETSQTVAVGRVVKDGNADHECQHTGAGENGFGVVVALGKLLGAAGDKVSIAMLAGGIIVPVKVGTGGAARGGYAKSVSDGVTTATPAAAATGTSVFVHGMFTQSGVAGDVVGMLVAPGWITEA